MKTKYLMFILTLSVAFPFSVCVGISRDNGSSAITWEKEPGAVVPKTGISGYQVTKLQDMRPTELADAIGSGATLLIPAGVIEYHGPHLPLGTDLFEAELICYSLAQTENVVIAPSIMFGPLNGLPHNLSEGWGGFVDQGEMNYSAENMKNYVKPLLELYYLMGWKRIAIIQMHGGHNDSPSWPNQNPTLRRLIKEVRDENPGMPDAWNIPPPVAPDAYPYGFTNATHTAGVFLIAKVDEFCKLGHYFGHGDIGEIEWVLNWDDSLVDLDALYKLSLAEIASGRYTTNTKRLLTDFITRYKAGTFHPTKANGALTIAQCVNSWKIILRKK